MLEICILVGLPSSGKTTFARYFQSIRHRFVRVSLKDVAKMIDCVYDPDHVETYNSYYLKLVDAAIAAGDNLLLDDINLTLEGRKIIIDRARAHSIPVTVYQMAVTSAQCLELDTSLNPFVLDELVKAYAYPLMSEGFKQIKGVRWRDVGKGPHPEIFDIAPANLNMARRRGSSTV